MSQPKDIRIVILPSGFVFIGEFSRPNGAIHLENASCIRKWGTDRGLGQLALEGKQPNTVLDYCGTLDADSMIASIRCDPEKWL